MKPERPTGSRLKLTPHGARRRTLFGALLLGALCFGTSACVSVAPYAREDLASPGMEASHEEAEMEFRAHVHDSREGATGGHSSTGGGCGCN